MGFPRLRIHLDRIRHNATVIRSLCEQYGITVMGITKVFVGEPLIAQALVDAGIRRLGDSRVTNLQKYSALPVEKWLIRMPMCSEADDVVRYADGSLNSEWRVICALDEAASRLGKIHQIILMVDLGDLREGYMGAEALLTVAQKAEQLSHIRLVGVGTNLSCFSFIHPDTQKMNQLKELAVKLPMTGTPLVSGGNSATLHLMYNGGIPQGVNQLRLGESLLFGKERCCYTFLPGTKRETFVLQAEIIECKTKPSVPWGNSGVDSYGHAPKTPIDRGMRKRAILALGKQDCDVETMRPLDAGIELLGASSDHMVLDITDSPIAYDVGDIVSFELGYFALMRAFTSPYVEKMYCDADSNDLGA